MPGDSLMRRRSLVVAAVSLLALATALSNTAQPRAKTLTLSVATSLQDVAKAIQPLYQAQAPEVKLIFNFGSSGSLQRQIEQGAPTDIFISAAAKQMNALEDKGLILGESRFDLAVNRLVLVTPKGESAIATAQDLTQPDIEQLALGEPTSVPAGNYAQQALTTLDLFTGLSPKFIFAKDVRQVLNYVETGNVDAGIVYQTDALLADAVEVALVFPPQTHTPIVYPVAVVADSRHPEAALDFKAFLKEDAVQAILTEFGFETAN